MEFDEFVAHYEVHAHQPYTSSSFNNFQHQDLCLLPSRSSLHIHGRLTKADGTARVNTKLVNNALCHLFEEIRYEINAVEIDKCKNVGLTSLMKGLVSFNPTQKLENAGWIDIAETQQITDNAGYFDVSIPLTMILGFAEDYRKIIVNCKHELVLTRSKNDVNAIVQTESEEFKINLIKIEWLMPYVVLSDKHKIRLLHHLQKGTTIAMNFRSWELYEYLLLPTSTACLDCKDIKSWKNHVSSFWAFRLIVKDRVNQTLAALTTAI